MSEQPKPDWDPKAPEVLRDQRASYDDMRRRCPVAHSEFLGWSLFRHDDVTRALLDHDSFSNAVSQHLNVPSGMDQPEHTEYRRIIYPYFSAERMAAFEPICRDIAAKVINGLTTQQETELIAHAATPFAAQIQCAFLGWPIELQQQLAQWTRKQHDATLAQDRKAMSELAVEFETIIDDAIETRLRSNAGLETDITAALMHEKVWGRRLSNEELASILRNWTVGEIGTISAAVGILVEYLAMHADLQNQLRTNPSLLPAAIEEILRIHGPLVSNRRVAKCPIEIGGRKINAGERITLMWMSANRDERVFENPDSFRLDRDQSKNLLYGAGIHWCPGAPLARLELRIFMEELLSRTVQMAPVHDNPPKLAVYPASGFDILPLKIHFTS
jgi:cytochrome P450